MGRWRLADKCCLSVKPYRLVFRLPYRVNKGSLKTRNGALAARRYLGNPYHSVQPPLGGEPLPLHFQAALGNGWGSLKFGSLKPKMERQRLAANTPSVTRFAKVSV